MYICAVDIGTTGIKSMFLDDKNKICAFSYKEYPTFKFPDGRIEQNAEDWWNTVAATIRDCSKQTGRADEVGAVCLSAQGGALVVTDGKGVPYGNAISWMDNCRGLPYVRELLKERSEEWYYARSGWRLNPGMSAAKILWLRSNCPELLKKGNKLLSTIDYINYKFSGKFVIDKTSAAMMQTFDIRTGSWNEELLGILNVDLAMLPEVVPSGEVIGELTQGALDECGLSGKVLLVSGGHDQYCAAIGAGAVNDGDILISTGTAWAILGISKHIAYDMTSYPGVGTHIVPGMMGCMCTVPTGGASLEWLRSGFIPPGIKEGSHVKESLKNMDLEAEKCLEKKSDLLFYPYFLGSGYPYWNQNIRASFIGFEIEHNSYDAALAVMEGIAFQTACIIENYARHGIAAKEVKLIGGASKSKLWTRIISNIIGLPVMKFSEPDIACVGAAIIAGKGYGLFDSYREGFEKVAGFERYPIPMDDTRDYYLKKFERYKKGSQLLELLS